MFVSPVGGVPVVEYFTLSPVLNSWDVKVKILDATWHLPNSGKDAENDFNLSHIKNSLFFDIDKNSNKKID